MIKLEIESIRNPRWSSEDHSSIDCLVKFNTLIDEVPFTASCAMLVMKFMSM